MAEARPNPKDFNGDSDGDNDENEASDKLSPGQKQIPAKQKKKEKQKSPEQSYKSNELPNILPVHQMSSRLDALIKSPIKCQITSPGNSSKASPGNSSKASPGNSSKASPGKYRMDSPGNSRVFSPGAVRMLSPGTVQNPSPEASQPFSSETSLQTGSEPSSDQFYLRNIKLQFSDQPPPIPPRKPVSKQPSGSSISPHHPARQSPQKTQPPSSNSEGGARSKIPNRTLLESLNSERGATSVSSVVQSNIVRSEPCRVSSGKGLVALTENPKFAVAQSMQISQKRIPDVSSEDQQNVAAQIVPGQIVTVSSKELIQPSLNKCTEVSPQKNPPSEFLRFKHQSPRDTQNDPGQYSIHSKSTPRKLSGGCLEDRSAYESLYQGQSSNAAKGHQRELSRLPSFKDSFSSHPLKKYELPKETPKDSGQYAFHSKQSSQKSSEGYPEKASAYGSGYQGQSESAAKEHEREMSQHESFQKTLPQSSSRDPLKEPGQYERYTVSSPQKRSRGYAGEVSAHKSGYQGLSTDAANGHQRQLSQNANFQKTLPPCAPSGQDLLRDPPSHFQPPPYSPPPYHQAIAHSRRQDLLRGPPEYSQSTAHTPGRQDLRRDPPEYSKQQPHSSRSHELPGDAPKEPGPPPYTSRREDLPRDTTGYSAPPQYNPMKHKSPGAASRDPGQYESYPGPSPQKPFAGNPQNVLPCEGGYQGQYQGQGEESSQQHANFQRAVSSRRNSASTQYANVKGLKEYREKTPEKSDDSDEDGRETAC